LFASLPRLGMVTIMRAEGKDLLEPAGC
jgi:hypothetical protein